jgi:excisionase family DNA binding protein
MSGSELLTVQELAGMLRVPRSWIYARTCDGAEEVIPHLKFGRHLRFQLSQIERWVEEHRRGDESSGKQPEDDTQHKENTTVNPGPLT